MRSKLNAMRPGLPCLPLLQRNGQGSMHLALAAFHINKAKFHEPGQGTLDDGNE